MPPKKDAGKDKPKAAKKEGAKANKGGKAKKKKWSKAKTRERINNMVLFDKATYDKLLKDIPSSKLITPSTIAERLKVNGSLARRAIKELESKGLIRMVSRNHRQIIYTRATTGGASA